MNIPTSLALALMLGGAAAAAQGVAPPPERETGRSQDRAYVQSTDEMHRATGIVITVDAATGKLKLKDDAGKITRYDAKKAKVEAAQGRVLSLADLSIGDTVTVSYRGVAGKNVTMIQRLHKAVKR